MMLILNSILLGIGLAMDAFSVSLANGLHEREMPRAKMLCVSGVFAFFQGLMPMVGWICVHTVLQHFKTFEKFIPWIALCLLALIGSKMIFDSLRGEDGDEQPKVGVLAILVQGVATSIDALSVGFTIAEYDILSALASVLIIALITFVICLCGVYIGKKFGTKLSSKATLFGGILLILIGIEIFITGIL
ncbi:MAG: manganese efflux pump [Clostridia bacterium]|nr:manganese efflux pump [Clostridia bacterium]